MPTMNACKMSGIGRTDERRHMKGGLVLIGKPPWIHSAPPPETRNPGFRRGFVYDFRNGGNLRTRTDISLLQTEPGDAKQAGMTPCAMRWKNVVNRVSKSLFVPRLQKTSLISTTCPSRTVISTVLLPT